MRRDLCIAWKKTMNVRKLKIEELIPHRDSMLLIEEICDITETSATTETCLHENLLFVNSGILEPYSLIEFMAQTVAIMFGYRNIASGGEVQKGLLVGVDNVVFSERQACVGETICIHIHEIAAISGFGTYNGCVRIGDNELCTGILKVLVDRRSS